MYERCLRCDKKLKDQKSKESGYGPKCRKKNKEQGEQMVIDHYGVWDQKGDAA